MSQYSDLFGKAKYGGGARFRNHKLKPGDNIFRIGPPYKSLAAEGRWYWFTRQHFGYVGTDPKDPSKTVARPFLCPLEIDRRTEMVKVPCAECAKIEQMNELVEQRTAALAAEGKDEAEIEELVGPLKLWLKSHNVDKKYNVLAKNSQGEWGVLPLPYKAKEAFDQRRTELGAEGIDPTDIDGVWLNFKRTGERLKTAYACDVVTESEIVNGRRVFSHKLDTLTDADFQSIVNDCPDLPTVGRKLTQEQIDMLVNSSGDPEEVDRIMNMGTKREASPSPKPAARPAPTAKPVVPQPLPKAKALPPEPEQPEPEDVTPTESEDEELAALMAKMNEIKAKKAAAAKPNPIPQAKPKPAFNAAQAGDEIARKNPDALGDAEFAALFGKVD